MAKSHKIVRFRGDTYPMEVTLKENGLPMDLTGLIIKLTIGLKTPYAIEGDDGGAPTAGVVTFQFPEDAVLYAGEFTYDIAMQDFYGIRTTLIKDTIEFTDDINKSTLFVT